MYSTAIFVISTEAVYYVIITVTEGFFRKNSTEEWTCVRYWWICRCQIIFSLLLYIVFPCRLIRSFGSSYLI